MTRGWLACGAVLLVLTVSGCAGTSAPPATTTVTTTPDPVNTCAMQLQYWAQQSLSNAKDTGLDYQEMGLSGAQDEALLELLRQARKLPSGQATPSWLLDQAKAACQQLAASAKPTTSVVGWP